MRKSGKRSQIEELNEKGEATEMEQFTYILQHDNGFAFMFENQEPSRVLLIKMLMTVENLIENPSSVENKDGTIEWRLKLEPGQHSTKDLVIQDVKSRTSMKYSFNFKNYHIEQLKDKTLIIAKCVASGNRY